MKKLKFEEDDFTIHGDPNYALTIIKNRAQAKHDAWLKELLVSSMDLYASEADSYHWTHRKDVRDTHHGLLINIEEIEKNCEKHEPEFTDQSYKLPDIVRCKHCGVELVAKWAPNWTAK